jgi:hypothetical protein
MMGFQVILFVLQQNRKYGAHIPACLSCLDILVRPNGKSDRVSENSMDHFQAAIYSPCPLM